MGASISYASVLLLKDAWAVHDLQLCSDCPNGIAEDKPGIIIVGNDDFQNDTLTGGNARMQCMHSKSPFKTMVLSVMNGLKMPKPYHEP